MFQNGTTRRAAFNVLMVSGVDWCCAGVVAVLVISSFGVTGCGRQVPSEPAGAPGEHGGNNHGAGSPGTATAAGGVSSASSPAGATRRPTPADLAAFIQAELCLPPEQLTVEVQTDTPATAATEPAGSWIVPAKVTFRPQFDLFAPAPAGDAALAEFQRLDQEREALARWAEAFARTSLAQRRYPNLSLFPTATAEAGSPTLPTLLVRRTAKGQALPSLYLRYTATWQVDRWLFTPLGGTSGSLPDFSRAGEPLEAYPAGSAVVVGSPEAQALLAAKTRAVADAWAKKEEVIAAYRALAADATRPGSRYVGRLLNPGGTLAAEVRFVAAPASTAAPGAVAFEVVLPGHPDYGLSFVGKLNATVPPEPGEPDLSARCTARRGQPTNTLLGSLVKVSTTVYNGPEEKPFAFTEGEFKGTVSGFNGDYRFAGTRAP